MTLRAAAYLPGVFLPWLPAALLLTGCSDRIAHSAAATSTSGTPPLARGCTGDGSGFLRASLRGAIDADLDWPDAALTCEGGHRPDGNGIRLSFSGPATPDGQTLRIVIGLASGATGSQASANPTPANMTVIVEGRSQLFSTRGDGHCAVDNLSASALDGNGGTQRLSGRGYCIDPATTLDGQLRLFINRFDFAGKIAGDDTEPD